MDLKTFRFELSCVYKTIHFDPAGFFREKAADPSMIHTFLANTEPLLEQLRSNNDQELFFVRGAIGNLCRIIGPSEKALTLLKENLEYALAQDAKKNEIISFIRLGEAYKYNHKHADAIRLFDNALLKCGMYEEVEYLDFANQHKGKCLLEMGIYPEAIENLKAALKIRMKKKDEQLIYSTKQVLELAEKLGNKPTKNQKRSP
ncbi:hypothetical protein [Bacillus sp. 1P06AnD]|uniref:hypothetical protein n=1 Tax=Bacillus sp. 1P06AnD TaxID=3132208 RepID=UPI00399F0EE6